MPLQLAVNLISNLLIGGLIGYLSAAIGGGDKVSRWWHVLLFVTVYVHYFTKT